MTKENINNDKSKYNLNYSVGFKIKTIEVMEQITSVENLKLAWYQVRSNSFISTQKLWLEALVNGNDNWFYNLSRKLLRGWYRYKKAIEVTIFKKNCKACFFKMVSFKDVMVQKAFFLVLAKALESQNCFGSCNSKMYGMYVNIFKKRLGSLKTYDQNLKNRFNCQDLSKIVLDKFFFKLGLQKSVHSVMRVIKEDWKSLNYFVTYIIEKTFDKINYNILMKEVEKYIRDKKVSNEIWKMLNVYNVDFKVKPTGFTLLNIPKNSALSLLLFDIYMTKLDRFLESILLEIVNKSKVINSLEWRKLIKDSRAKKFFFCQVEYFQLTRSLFKKTIHIIRPGFKLLYVRHIADLLLGYCGNKSDLYYLLKKIEVFINSNLYLKKISFKLTSLLNNHINYLGFKLKYSKKIFINKSKLTHIFEKLKNRLVMRKLIENSKYLKVLEWAGRTFYRKAVEQTLQNSNQVWIKQEKDLKNALVRWGQRDGLVHLISVLEQSLLLWNVTLGDSDSSTNDSYYTMAKQFRENRYKEFIKRWYGAAKILAQTAIEDGIKNFFPVEIAQTFDIARKFFLLEINKLQNTNPCLPLISNLVFVPIKPTLFFKNPTHITPVNSSIVIYLDEKDVMKQFKEHGIVNKKYRPICFNKLCSLEDYQIINQMATIAYTFMYFYSCVGNLWKVKKLVDYVLRYSLAATLARKFKVSLKKIFDIYGNDLSVAVRFKGNPIKIARFPDKSKVYSFKYGFTLLSYSFYNQSLWNVQLNNSLVVNLNLLRFCAVIGCEAIDGIEIYCVKTVKLNQKQNVTSFNNKNGMRFRFCWKFLESVFRCHTVTLCYKHCVELNNGFLVSSDLNIIVQSMKLVKQHSFCKDAK